LNSSCPIPANRFDSAPAKIDDTGEQNPRQHAAADPWIAMRHRARNREHDADDQAGLEDFAENDDQCGNHDAFLRVVI
jgi:hypothetical protein